MTRRILIPTMAFCLFFFVLAAQADRSERDLNQLLDELRDLTDKARKERAADRWLQRDLEALVANYDNPWRKEILFEDFRDGNYNQNPSWQVLSGDFYVEYGKGLVTSTIADQPQPAQTSQSQQDTSPEAALSDMLVGAALDSLLGPSKKKQQQPSPAPRASGPSEIRVPAMITNSFSIETSFTLRDRRDSSRVEFAVLQGDSARYGYRLILTSGDRPVIELERIRNGRVSIVDGVRLEQLIADGNRHDLLWQQATDGSIKIEIDGKPTLNMNDRAFRDDYQWFQLGLISGDLVMHRLEIKGTE